MGGYLDYNVSSGPFLSYETEIGDGPGPELDNNGLSEFHLSVQCWLTSKLYKFKFIPM